MNGIINVLKPSGMTSHDIVNFIRRTLEIKKVGHTGTLDPNAAGVLPICIGKATKIIEYISKNRKKYRAELTLGVETDTQDSYGNIVNRSKTIPSTAEIISAFNEFTGTIDQIPPMYSAIKYNGKRLYELARQGKNIERKSRKVTIYSLDIVKVDKNKVLFDVECSPGTYIRTLCHDIGNRLGSYGYMSFLLRTEVYPFKISDSYTIEEILDINKKQKIKDILLPMDYPLSDYNKINFNRRYLKSLVNGATIKLDKENAEFKYAIKINENVLVYCDNRFIGVGIVILNNGQKFMRLKKVLI